MTIKNLNAGISLQKDIMNRLELTLHGLLGK